MLWKAPQKKKLNSTCHQRNASYNNPHRLTLSVRLSLHVYLNMMAVHVSVQRGGAGGDGLAVTLFLH